MRISALIFLTMLAALVLFYWAFGLWGLVIAACIGFVLSNVQ